MRNNRCVRFLVSTLGAWAALLAAATAYGHEEFLPPAPPPARPAGPTLATVNGMPVSLRDYQDAVPFGQRRSLTTRQILRKAIHAELLRQEGIRLGFDKDPALAKRLEWLRKEYVKDQLKRRELDRLGEISQSDLRRFYEAHKEEFTADERLVASHILLRTRAAAEDVLAWLRKGADFAALARDRSEDPATRADGGRLRVLSRGEMSPEFEQAALALRPGEVSGIVEGRSGFQIIKLHERIPARLEPLDEVKRRVRERVIDERLRGFAERLYADAERNLAIEYREDAIRKLTALLPDKVDSDTVLATAGGTPITVHDFEHAFFKLDRARRDLVRKDPSRLLRGLISDKLLQQEGLRLGLDQDPAFVQYLEQIERGHLVTRLAQVALAKVSTVSEDAARQYYDVHRDEFTDPELVAIGHILLRSRKAAEEVLARLRAGADFTGLVRERSEDHLTRSEGGRRFIRRGQTSPELEQVAFTLNPGELSGVIEDEKGFHIIQVHQRQPSRLRSFEEVRGLIRTKLATQAQTTAWEQYLAGLEKQAAIEINEAELAQLE